VVSAARLYSTGWGRRVRSSACRASSSYPAAIRNISRLTRGSIMVVAWRRTSSARPSQYSALKPLDDNLAPELPKSLQQLLAVRKVPYHRIVTTCRGPTQVRPASGWCLAVGLGPPFNSLSAYADLRRLVCSVLSRLGDEVGRLRAW
jgi:hypothetical protein